MPPQPHFHRAFWHAVLGCMVALAGCATRGQPPVLTVVGFGLQAGAELQRDALEEFTRSTGIRVKLAPAWGSSAEQRDEIAKLLKLGSHAPDIYLIDLVWPGVLGPELLDLAPFLSGAERGHLPVLLQNDTVHGRLVSLPFYVNVGVLYYRTDLLAKYGYREPPGTWQELYTMADRIQRGERAGGTLDFWGYVWQGAAYEGLTCDALEWQQDFGGGRIIEHNGVVSVNNPQTAEALRMARGWIGRISPPGVPSYTESDSLAVFRAGKAAFLRHWSGALAASRLGDAPIVGRFGMAALPAGPHGRAHVIGGFHLAVGRRSEHPRESVQLVRYLTGRGVQLQRARSGGYLPTVARLYDSPEVLRLIPAAAAPQRAGGSGWITRPSTIAGSKYADVSRAYYEAIHGILGSKSDPATALENLEHTLTALTGFPAGPPPNR